MLKIAKVYWTDSRYYSCKDDIAWFADNAKTIEVITTGHIIKVRRNEIVIAGEIAEGQARHVSVILRKNINKIEYLEMKSEA